MSQKSSSLGYRREGQRWDPADGNTAKDGLRRLNKNKKCAQSKKMYEQERNGRERGRKGRRKGRKGRKKEKERRAKRGKKKNRLPSGFCHFSASASVVWQLVELGIPNSTVCPGKATQS